MKAVIHKKHHTYQPWALYAVIGLCAIPVILSYLTYYVIKPIARTNYGTLLEPRLYPIPKTNGLLKALTTYRGKWIMLQVSVLPCETNCQKGLLDMRQLRIMQGKDRDRIERVLLIINHPYPLDASLSKVFEGTHFLWADKKTIEAWLPVEADKSVTDRLYLIDPLGNVIMRYVEGARPEKIHKDVTRLLKASHIG